MNLSISKYSLPDFYNEKQFIPHIYFFSKKKPIANMMLVIGLKRFWETIRIKFFISLSELVYTTKTN